MLSVPNAAISPIPIQPPLVATAMPNAIATIRVPPDSVSAPVFTPPVSNNASGNGNAYAASPPAPAITAAEAGIVGTFLVDSEAQFWASPQATFLAQIIGQGMSPEARSVLVLYERLMTMGNVKYKPSNAGMPSPEPAGMFGRLLHQEKSAPVERLPVEIQTPVPPPAPEQVQAAPVQSVEIVRPAPAEQPRPARTSAAAQKATHAYQATAAALDTPASKPPADSAAEIGGAV